jgi:hypothetical protein
MGSRIWRGHQRFMKVIMSTESYCVVLLQTIIPHQFKISDQDIQKIADAVKANIMTDITNLVLSH